MLDPRDLFTVDEDIRAGLAGHRPVLVHLTEGFIDGGQVGTVIDAHLMEQCDHEVLVEFDHDQLHDYRARRPTMVFHQNSWESVSLPKLRIHRLIDDHGEPFLLLRGTEPAVQWERTAAAVTQLCHDLDVRLAATVAGAPMGVPHTRPLGVTAHASQPDLLATEDLSDRWANVEVPGSFNGFLQYTLGRNDIPAAGHFVHVPHYLAQTAYLEAAEVGLTKLLGLTGLGIPLAGLTDAAVFNRSQIDEELSNSPEAQEVVAALEEQYDEVTEPQVPSGDELAAEFQRFLAEQPDTDPDT
ncbi:proteasome assembly chaperone family protein [Enemella sp. A6]|uniref:proteasome assembly chaperone family protein n=1 Tax=Enemella sp. A6 TaxID=3440152 RepID=UPI003EB73BB3